MSTSGKQIRCAIYTRKSTDEGLEREFNSLDAQRESAEAYIAAQKHEGWLCLPDCYDDGGYTGGNLDRPGVQRLMRDIEAGKIDCVVVYKVDRLSRSLLDFAKMMEIFDKHQVSFVSVTQQFNTTHSMGRLTLNILLSFAQFEREIISERTRDKIAAARRKGKWSGGPPVLGYDIRRAPGGSKLIVNTQEADQVRRIFELYLERDSIMQTIRRLDELGWVNKRWTTTGGKKRGGRPFDKASLLKLLTNVIYFGRVRHKDKVYAGEHDPIVDEDLFRRVQGRLGCNRHSGGKYVSNKYGALLKGLVRCKACSCGMSHHFATNGGKRYRYYVCLNAQKRGWDNCPSPSLPAGELEQFVVEQIRGLGRDDQLITGVMRQTQALLRDQLTAVQRQRQTIVEEGKRLSIQVRQAVGKPAELAELQERLQAVERRTTELDDKIEKLCVRAVDQDELVGAIEAFDPVWDRLSPREKEKLVRLLVRQVEYDAESEAVSVTFHDAGIKGMSMEEVAA